RCIDSGTRLTARQTPPGGPPGRRERSMAAPTAAQGKTAGKTRSAPAPRQQNSPPAGGKRGKRLQVRHYAVLKRRRVYPLVVEVPRGDEGGEGGRVVVVRPVVPGALVVPAEQRLDVGTPGNQVTFDVTALARGRLPRAHVEVFAP